MVRNDEILKEKENDLDFEKAYRQLAFEKDEHVSGLEYASIIQNGILPKDRHFKRIFDESFVFHRQRDLIGGDFYWTGQSGDLSFVAVGDCAGHGVPGALLSMLGQSLLNYYVSAKGIIQVDDILEELDNRLTETFLPANHTDHLNDWISLSVCCIDRNHRTLSFAGAGHNMFYRTCDDLLFIPGNKVPLGAGRVYNHSRYDQIQIDFCENDICYLFTDGISDQFGKLSGKKLTRKGLRDALLRISEVPFSRQGEIFKNFFEGWKGNRDQTDDLTLLGFKL